MEYQEALAFIHNRPRLPSKGSPERMRVLLDRVGHPEQKLSFVHITGTNGKGSAAAMISSILIESGKKAGMFTSPYVCDYRERFQINATLISKNKLTNLIKKIQIPIDEMEKKGHFVTEFELGTVLAFQYFLEQQCDVVVMEVGIGGEHDATNVIPPPLVSVMMPVGIDHAGILGNSLKSIAREKAGIIKGNPVVSYPLQAPEALEVIMARCAQTGSRLVMPAAASIKIYRSDLRGTAFRYGDQEYFVPLIGEHQAYNGAVAVETAKILGVALDTVKRGLSKAQLPARIEILRQDPLIILDGAHNLDAVKALCENVKKWNIPHLAAVVGMMKDKDVEEVLFLLSDVAEKIRTVSIDYPRAATAEQLAEEARTYCDDVQALGTVQQAVRWVLEQQTPVFICGSFYLAGEMRHFLF